MKAIISKNLVLISSATVIFIGFVFLMMPSATYGFGERCISDQCGIFFTNRFRAMDDLWHMSLARIAFDTYPFQMPTYSGAILQGYHFLYSFVLMLVNLLGYNVLTAYYVILPVIWFTIYTTLTIMLSRLLIADKRAIPLFLFFSYFSSGFTYLLSLKNTGSPLNDIGWFSNQPGEYMINPTFALSLIIFQIIIYLLLKNTNSFKSIVGLSFFVFLMWGAKFYGGVIACIFIGIFTLANTCLGGHKMKYSVVLGFSVLVTSLISILFFYHPFSSLHGGGVFMLEPFKTIHPMIEDPSLFPILKLARLRYKLYEHFVLFLPLIIIIELFTLFLYIVFDLGTRLIGLKLLFSRQRSQPIHIALFGSSIMSIIFAATLIQRNGDWFNTIQFLGYTQFLLQISLAVCTVYLLKTGSLKSRIVVATIVVITFLGSLNPVIEYGKDLFIPANSPIHAIFQPKVYVSSSEIKALSYLSKLAPGVTYTFPFTPIYDNRPVKQLWKTNDTALVAALGNQQLYEANIQQLDITGINHQMRTQSLKNIQMTNIKTLPIRYLYLYKQHPEYRKFITRISPSTVSLFENEEIHILERM